MDDKNHTIIITWFCNDFKLMMDDTAEVQVSTFVCNDEWLCQPKTSKSEVTWSALYYPRNTNDLNDDGDWHLIASFAESVTVSYSNGLWRRLTNATKDPMYANDELRRGAALQSPGMGASHHRNLIRENVNDYWHDYGYHITYHQQLLVDFKVPVQLNK